MYIYSRSKRNHSNVCIEKIGYRSICHMNPNPSSRWVILFPISPFIRHGRTGWKECDFSQTDSHQRHSHPRWWCLLLREPRSSTKSDWNNNSSRLILKTPLLRQRRKKKSTSAKPRGYFDYARETERARKTMILEESIRFVSSSAATATRK